jgi:hypothetical protein
MKNKRDSTFLRAARMMQRDNRGACGVIGDARNREESLEYHQFFQDLFDTQPHPGGWEGAWYFGRTFSHAYTLAQKREAAEARKHRVLALLLADIIYNEETK